jgi:hypothetical protein
MEQCFTSKQRRRRPIRLARSCTYHRREFYSACRAIALIGCNSSGPASAGPIPAVPYLNEQTFLAHAGQIATRNTDVGEFACPHDPPLLDQGNRPLSQRRLAPAAQSQCLGPLPVAFAHSGSLGRIPEWWDSVFVVRAITVPGEPNVFEIKVFFRFSGRYPQAYPRQESPSPPYKPSRRWWPDTVSPRGPSRAPIFEASDPSTIAQRLWVSRE